MAREGRHNVIYDYSSTACTTGVFIVERMGEMTVVQQPATGAFTSEIAVDASDIPHVSLPEVSRPALPRYAAPAERRPWRGDAGRDRRDPRLLRHALTRWRRAA